MDLLEEFWRLISFGIYDPYDEDYDQYICDSSEYKIIDNEEGDHGIKKYYLNGNHIATYYNQGGDVDWWEFTQEGKEHFRSKVLKVINDEIDQL